MYVQSAASGSGSIVDGPSSAPSAQADGADHVLENAQFRLVISRGRITSLYDKREARELILPGPGADTAGFMLYEDFPLNYDAWDAEVYHLEMGKALVFDTVEIVANGPLRASIKATARFGKSVASMTVRMAPDVANPQFSLDAADDSDSAIRIDTYIDWHEKHKFIKCE